MKNSKQIEKMRLKIAEHAKAKRERIDHFQKGGTLSSFNPKFKNVAKPV